MQRAPWTRKPPTPAGQETAAQNNKAIFTVWEHYARPECSIRRACDTGGWGSTQTNLGAGKRFVLHRVRGPKTTQEPCSGRHARHLTSHRNQHVHRCGSLHEVSGWWGPHVREGVRTRERRLQLRQLPC